MNTYNIYEEKEYRTILYHAIAENEEQVKEMAKERNINIDELTIELMRENIIGFNGKPLPKSFDNALID